MMAQKKQGLRLLFSETKAINISLQLMRKQTDFRHQTSILQSVNDRGMRAAADKNILT